MNKKWLRASLTRALRTVAQTMIANIGTSVLLSEVNWTVVVSSSLLAGLISILMSISGLPEVDNGKEKGAEDESK